MADTEFKQFIKYMSSLWAILAGMTAIFPLADVLFKVIPLPVDAYGKSTAAVAIPLTTVAALFAILYTFVQRDKYKLATTNKSGIFFLLGMFSLATFFLLEHFEEPLRINLFPSLDSSDDYVLLLIAVVPFYAAFFAFVTRAFMILALIEFKRKRGLTNRSSGRS